MKSAFALVALAVACVQPALGHYRFFKYIDAAGTVNGEYTYIRPNTNINSPVSVCVSWFLGFNSPCLNLKVTDVSSTDLRCNAGGVTSGSKTSTTTVAAGSTVGFQADIRESEIVATRYGSLIYPPYQSSEPPRPDPGLPRKGAFWFDRCDLGRKWCQLVQDLCARS